MRKNRNFKRKHKTVLSLFDLNILLNSGHHQMLSKLASLSISSLHKLDDEANKFYDRKHDLLKSMHDAGPRKRTLRLTHCLNGLTR